MAPIVQPSADRESGHRLTRIVVSGSESTGKTLLAQQLADHYDVSWVPEFARDYAEERNAPLTAADVDPIGRGQVAREDAALRTARGLIILDTDLVSTMVYGDQFYGFVPEWIPDVARQRLADLYLVCDIDFPWVVDPVREGEYLRGKMHEAFIRNLTALGATFRVISGSGEARLERAIESIDASQLLAPP